MLPLRHWTTFILLLFFAITCQGYNYGNDTDVEFFDARDLEVRAGPEESSPGSLHKLRIVAVGDVHGDYDRFISILKHLEVIDNDSKWTGKVDVFVQLGDLMDRGPDVKKLFSYMDELRSEAEKKGGTVYTLLGNHEVENLMYYWSYVNQDELKTFMSTDDRRRALTSSGSIGKSLANNHLGALRLPLHKPVRNTPYEKGVKSQFSHSAIAFVHGGLCPSTYQELLPFPTKINRMTKDLVKRLQDFLSTNIKEPRPFFGMSSHVIIFSVPVTLLVLCIDENDLTPEQKLIYEGPLQYRGLAFKPNCNEVEKMLNDIGVRRIVVGHTRNNEGIVEKCNGKIIVIDTGITRWESKKSPTTNKWQWVEGKGGRLSALDIRYTFDGEKTQTEVIHAVYPGLKKPDDSQQLTNIPF